MCQCCSWRPPSAKPMLQNPCLCLKAGSTAWCLHDQTGKHSMHPHGEPMCLLHDLGHANHWQCVTSAIAQAVAPKTFSSMLVRLLSNTFVLQTIQFPEGTVQPRGSSAFFHEHRLLGGWPGIQYDEPCAGKASPEFTECRSSTRVPVDPSAKQTAYTGAEASTVISATACTSLRSTTPINLHWATATC